MDRMIGFCGIVCTDCQAYIVTQTGDDEARKKIAEGWSSEEYPVKPEEISCDGCLPIGKRLFKFCTDCVVRTCGLEKKVENCGHCDEYICEKLSGLWTKLEIEKGKEVLDEVRKGL